MSASWFMILLHVNSKLHFFKEASKSNLPSCIVESPLFKYQNILVCICAHMGPCFFFSLEHLFCLFHNKIHWTMSTDDGGLKICLLRTLNSRGCTPLSSRTPHTRQNNLLFLSCITKMDQIFIKFFMSAYTRYLLHTKNP